MSNVWVSKILYVYGMKIGEIMKRKKLGFDERTNHIKEMEYIFYTVVANESNIA